MGFETIAVATDVRGIARITLQRPERGNALNQAMIDELGTALRELAADAAVRVVAIRSTGKHFCAGADVGEMHASGTMPGMPMGQMLRTVERFPKPTIALVHGAAAGAGMALAACCDIVIAATEAFFTIPEVRLGWAPSLPMTALFVRAIGFRALRRYGFSGEQISATEAHRLGLAMEVCPRGELDARAGTIADALLHGAPGAIRELKERLNTWYLAPLPDLAATAERTLDDARRAENAEGISAFSERRKPSWYPEP